jgi:hypothetical protein
VVRNITLMGSTGRVAPVIPAGRKQERHTTMFIARRSGSTINARIQIDCGGGEMDNACPKYIEGQFPGRLVPEPWP